MPDRHSIFPPESTAYVDKTLADPFTWHEFSHSWDKGGAPLLSVRKTGFWIFTRYKWIAIRGMKIIKRGSKRTLEDAQLAAERYAISINPNYPWHSTISCKGGVK